MVSRWGDAPVHTIAAALFLKREEIHFFNDIGYSHSVATHCPYNDGLLKKCSCDIEYNHGIKKKKKKNLIKGGIYLFLFIFF